MGAETHGSFLPRRVRAALLSRADDLRDRVCVASGAAATSLSRSALGERVSRTSERVFRRHQRSTFGLVLGRTMSSLKVYVAVKRVVGERSAQSICTLQYVRAKEEQRSRSALTAPHAARSHRRLRGEDPLERRQVCGGHCECEDGHEPVLRDRRGGGRAAEGEEGRRPNRRRAWRFFPAGARARAGRGLALPRVLRQRRPPLPLRCRAAAPASSAQVTVGPKACAETLRTALAMGADAGIHVETDMRPDSDLQARGGGAVRAPCARPAGVC